MEMNPQSSHANGETSSAGNMRTKRKRGVDSSNCHQCHCKNDKDSVVQCTKCQKNYCIACITKWYPTMGEASVAESCPKCRKICNCKGCLQSDAVKNDLPNPDLEPCNREKIQYSLYILRVLVPVLKQIVAEQNMERKEAANITGLSLTGQRFPELISGLNDQAQCNNCKTSIFGVHRSCLNCAFKLCGTCCREIRDGSWAGNGQYHMHLLGTCPPEIVGGCGRGHLVVKSTYPENWVSELLTKAEPLADVGRYTDALEFSEAPCSCLRSDVKLCKAGDLKHFQWHLKRGEPVIVPGELSATPGLSWEPLVMWRACRIYEKSDQAPTRDFIVRNCSNWSEESINMHQFMKGCVDGFYDEEGRLKMLKLEDWPPSDSFQERLPRHSADFIRYLPFKQYTHPHAGYLNLSAKMPQMSLKPDLGPKMSIGYGAEEELGYNVITKLQYALSDRVNVLMHTAVSSLNREEPSMLEKLRRTHGAVWDVFRRQDVHILEEYLRTHSGEFRHNLSWQQLAQPIHEQAFYLTVEHKRKLLREYGIKPWTFVQRLGHAVFVPAGCPYQIRNLKSCISVGVNFVSPESAGECIRLSAEYRFLPRNHPFKEDKLQVKKLTLNAISQAVEFLDSFTRNAPSTSRNPPPYVPVRPPPPTNSSSVALMRQWWENYATMATGRRGPPFSTSRYR